MDSDYIFIMGAGRAGSKIYLNIINMSGDIHILPEMTYWTPWKFDVVDLLNRYGLKKNIDNLDLFLDDLANVKVIGSMWKQIRRKDIPYEKSKLKTYIEDNVISNESFLKALLNYYKNEYDVNQIGAKFPLHVSKISFLLNNFKKSKVIQITRKPHPMIISHARNLIYKKEKGLFRNPKNFFKYHIFIFHGILDYNWSSLIYFKNKNNDRLLLIKFEDIVLYPEKYVHKICDFLNIPYKLEMLNPPAVDSSYNRKIHTGFDKGALTNWKKKANIFEIIIITLTTFPGRILFQR